LGPGMCFDYPSLDLWFWVGLFCHYFRFNIYFILSRQFFSFCRDTLLFHHSFSFGHGCDTSHLLVCCSYHPWYSRLSWLTKLSINLHFYQFEQTGNTPAKYHSLAEHSKVLNKLFPLSLVSKVSPKNQVSCSVQFHWQYMMVGLH